MDCLSSKGHSSIEAPWTECSPVWHYLNSSAALNVYGVLKKVLAVGFRGWLRRGVLPQRWFDCFLFRRIASVTGGLSPGFELAYSRT